MIYFDNAATGGRKPDNVLSAVYSAVKTCANPGRGSHKLGLACAKAVQSCRYTLNDFFDGYGFDRVAFTKNCTEALNVALFGVLQKGDHVVTTCLEHNSVLRPLEFLKQAGVISYDVCPLTSNESFSEQNVSTENLLSYIKPSTKMVVLTSASNVNGAIPPLEKLRSALPKHILLLCDGAQGAGHIRLPMQKYGIDLLTLPGHKGLMGIQGSGALLFSERVNPRPILHGGTGSLSVSLQSPDFYPDALEAGTLNFPAIRAMEEGVRYLQFHESRIQSRLLTLTAYFLNGLKALPSYIPYSKANPCGIVAIKHKNIPSEPLSETLSEKYDIATRGGLHCAPLAHQAFGTAEDGLLRVSFSHFNGEREIDELLSALNDLA